MKKLSCILFTVTVLLSNIMCAVVAWTYRDIVCGMQHLGYSEPPSVAFLYAIPFLIGISACIVVAILLRKKAK